MNCKEVKKLLSDDLAIGARTSVRVHLKQCSHCRSLYETLAEIGDLSLNLRAGQGAPRDFSSSILQQTAALPPAPRFRWQPVAMVLSFLVVLGGAAVIWTPEIQRPLTSQQRGLARAPAREPAVLVEEPVIRDLSQPASGYVDVVIRHPSQPDQILRLPSTIQIRRSDLPREAYATKVSF